MQKIFYINTSKNTSLIDAELDEKINKFIGNTGKILSIIPSKVPGRNNTVDWLITAEDGKPIDASEPNLTI